MTSHDEQRILGAIDEAELVALTAELIRRPSVSGEEREVAYFMADWLRSRGLKAELEEIVPGRPNVIARWGADEGPSLLLTGHSDTVPIGNGWTRDPFGAERDGDRLYGRGSCDMKAGLAGMMLTLSALRRLVEKPAGSVIFAACIDEEEGGLGTQAAIRAGLRADWAVIGEPTDLTPICAAKGNCYFDVEVAGKAAHAGAPQNGVNAIYGAAEAIEGVRRHHDELQQRRHPLLGTPSLSVGTISGGMTVSAVPDRCRFGVDRRLLPGETGASALAELKDALKRHPPRVPGVSWEEKLVMEMPAMETPLDHPLLAALGAAARDAGGPALAPQGWTAACDGGFLTRDAQVPVALFGPGSITTQAHRPDEHVPVTESMVAARTYALLAHRAVTGRS